MGMKGMSLIIAAMTLVLIFMMFYAFLNIPYLKDTRIEKEIEIKTQIHTMANALDAAKLYIETGLEYSIYQACYESLKNGGWASLQGRPNYNGYAIWNDSGIGPGTTGFEEGMQESIKANLNLYRAKPYKFLSDNFVNMPAYDEVHVFTDRLDPALLLVTAYSQGNLNIAKNQESGEYIRLEKDSSLVNDDLYKVDCYGVYQKGIEAYGQAKQNVEDYLLGMDTSVDISQAKFVEGVRNALDGGWDIEQEFTWYDGDYSITAEVVQPNIRQFEIAQNQNGYNVDIKIKFEVKRDAGNEFPVFDGTGVSFQPMKLAFVIPIKMTLPLQQINRLNLAQTGSVVFAGPSLSFAEDIEEEICEDEDECGYMSECSITSYSDDGSEDEMECPLFDPCCEDAVKALTDDGWVVEGSCCNGGALPSGQMFSFGVKKGKKPVKPVVTPEQKLAYQKIAANHAEINGLSKSFVFAIIEKESSWNPKARSPTNVWGIMQVTQDTMKKLGWIKAEGSRLDPEISIKYGTKYLKKLMDMYGDEDLAAAGYSSAGPAVVSYALKYYCTKTPTYECVKKYLEDTEALVYVQKVNSFKQQYAALIASGTIKV